MPHRMFTAASLTSTYQMSTAYCTCGNQTCVHALSTILQGSKNQLKVTIYFILLRTQEQSSWKISPKGEPKKNKELAKINLSSTT